MRSIAKKQEESEDHSILFECASLILPWLTPLEIANVSLTCKTLHQISKTITHSRSLDVSRSLENLPIPFFNQIDKHPYAYFLYTPCILNSSPFPQKRQFWGSTFEVSSQPRGFQSGADSVSLIDVSGGCDCKSCEEVDEDEDDDDELGCPCLMGWKGLGIVNECGPSCGCEFECGNRLTQRGISVKLKIVKDEMKGWCLFADQFIQQGQFICEYAGEPLRTEEARKRQQFYDQQKSSGRFYSALLVVREHLPSGKACLRINIDATVIGNIARFINHSCDGGNLATNLVRSSGILMPRLCFFAAKDIKENEELTFSYGDTRVSSNGMQCFCGSRRCFGTLPSETTRCSKSSLLLTNYCSKITCNQIIKNQKIKQLRNHYHSIEEAYYAFCSTSCCRPVAPRHHSSLSSVSCSKLDGQ